MEKNSLMKKKKTTKKTKTHLKKKVSAILDSQERNPSSITEQSFGGEINRFVSQIDSLYKAFEPTMKTMEGVFEKSNDILNKFMKDKSIKITKKGAAEYSLKLKPNDMPQFGHNIRAVSTSALALVHIPRSLLCSFVSQYDAYLGRLLRVAFYAKPELLSASQKILTFSELMSFSSLEAARELIIEKEIESVIRESHIAHFDWMESRFGLTLRKDLSVWPVFIELTERRNIFVHCDGTVSSQYLKICKQNDVAFERPIKAGDQLDVSREYFHQAFNCLFEVGVKLGHVLWRKLLPDNIEKAEHDLHTIGYTLLVEERYDLVKIILSFAVDTLKKKSSDNLRRMNLINLACAHKFSGNIPESEKILKNEDWTACSDKFHLAVFVLQNEFGNATVLMKKIGTKGEVTRENYSSWPLFKEFRKSKEFLKTYKSLFGEEFVLPERVA